jgi:very-short-patch-repair endonuclease
MGNESAIAELARRQHGVVTAAQLYAAGFSRPTVAKRVRANRSHRIHRGVYAVGHRASSRQGRWMAAVLACGPGAVLSHRSAAELWELLRPTSGLIDVTIPTTAGRRKRDGIRIHRSPAVGMSALTHQSGIPVTTPARTLAELTRVISPGLHRKATRQAEFLNLDLGEIATDHTRSETERGFLAICRRSRIPPPHVNVPIGPFTVDFYWPDAGLVVEVGSYGSHRGRQAFDDDHARELYLAGRGLRLRRFSDTQIFGQPAQVAAGVLAELGPRAS